VDANFTLLSWFYKVELDLKSIF